MKINLDQSESNALEQFATSGANAVKVIEKILNESIADLKDITNIDPKGNMGLQTLARQEACKEVKAIKDLIFPALGEKKPLPGAPVARPYK